MEEPLLQALGGRRLTPAVSDAPGYSRRSPAHLVTGANLSGRESVLDTAGTDGSLMWLTERDPGENARLIFDFGQCEPLGYMLVWNFNQHKATGAGLRDVILETSIDGRLWRTLSDAPYRLAQASGQPGQAATNLDDGLHTPIDLRGTVARYLRITPDARPGVGNWGEYFEHQHRYGLTAVRFTRYWPRIVPGGRLYPSVKQAPSAEHPSLTLDLEGSYPVAQIQWPPLPDGVIIESTVDGRDWTALAVSGTVSEPNRPLRYLRLTAPDGWNGAEPGWEDFHITAGAGYCAEPARDMTGRLSRTQGWTGADGIFMAPLDGVERKPEPSERDGKRTLCVFSDTFIGAVDSETGARRQAEIVNNTLGFMTGTAPAKLTIDFAWGRHGSRGEGNIIPEPPGREYYYWFQDCAVIDGHLHIFTDNVVSDESGPEGFQFRLVGVDLLRAPLTEGQPDFSAIEYHETPLFQPDPRFYFGCAVLPNTFEGGLPGADGFVYVYGLRDKVGETERGYARRDLTVARVRPEELTDFAAWRFYDGTGFVPGMEHCAAISDDAGSESSVTPISTGRYAGKYLLVYTPSSVDARVACRLGDTPWGPFETEIPLYHIREPEYLQAAGARQVYCYNAKAHYHVSAPGELLISYNVNTTDLESHYLHADVYRPRFIRLRELVSP